MQIGSLCAVFAPSAIAASTAPGWGNVVSSILVYPIFYLYIEFDELLVKKATDAKPTKVDWVHREALPNWQL